MGKWIRVVIAVVVAVLAARYLKGRKHEADEPQWPEWSSTSTDSPAEPTSAVAAAEPVDATAPAEAAPAPTDDTPADGATWVEPDAEGDCPLTHPVKLKASSGIFHEPGMLNYERTNADRCYVSAEAAEADGHRAAKR